MVAGGPLAAPAETSLEAAPARGAQEEPVVGCVLAREAAPPRLAPESAPRQSSRSRPRGRRGRRWCPRRTRPLRDRSFPWRGLAPSRGRSSPAARAVCTQPSTSQRREAWTTSVVRFEGVWKNRMTRGSAAQPERRARPSRQPGRSGEELEAHVRDSTCEQRRIALSATLGQRGSAAGEVHRYDVDAAPETGPRRGSSRGR